jgi:periplasmic protein TonB
MSTTVTPFADRHFEIRFRPPAPARTPDTWQKMIGDKCIGARLDTLPENRISWRAMATSTFTQASIVLGLLLLQIIIPQSLITRVEYDVIPLAGPMIEVPKPPLVKPKIQPQPIRAPQPQPQPQHIAKLYVPRALPVPKPKPLEIRTTDVPKVEQAAVVPNLQVPDSEPVKPREVKMGVLGDSPAGGGFGDPHGLTGYTDPSKRVNVARLGSFDSNVGPGNGGAEGNGTGVGGKGGRGNGNGVASSGFGNGTQFASGKSAEGPKAVQSSGFQSAEVTPAPVKAAAKPTDAAPPTESIVILSKPNPLYTDEARRLGIEGEVLVDVVFLASGQIKVEGVSKGLGHGLDEAAIRAAQQIRFKPALQEGRAVDFPATVHIVFQIAF